MTTLCVGQTDLPIETNLFWFLFSGLYVFYRGITIGWGISEGVKTAVNKSSSGGIISWVGDHCVKFRGPE